MGTGELFSTYGAALLRCAKRVTGSDADAEEAVAETFLALVRHPAAIDPDREPWPYLRRAVLNRAFNQLRRRRRAPTPLPPDMTAPGMTGPGMTGPERERLDLAERLRDGIAQLTPRQAEDFILRRLEGAETAEIATALDLRPATVRVHLHQATHTLRKMFDPKEAPRV